MNATTKSNRTVVQRLVTVRQRRTSAETSWEVILICRASTVALHRNYRAIAYAAAEKWFRKVFGSGTNSVREELVNSNFVVEHHLKASAKYRIKALTCETLAREATDEATKVAWEELAIEWHILASRIAKDEKMMN